MRLKGGEKLNRKRSKCYRKERNNIEEKGEIEIEMREEKNKYTR